MTQRFDYAAHETTFFIETLITSIWLFMLFTR